mgnify:CR=1 FL=1
MAQNTKLAGYNAGATPLTGVNPVHTIRFGVCVTGRKSTDTPETVETKVVKDAESLSISVDGTIEEWNPMDHSAWLWVVSVIMVMKVMIISQAWH